MKKFFRPLFFLGLGLCFCPLKSTLFVRDDLAREILHGKNNKKFSEDFKKKIQMFLDISFMVQEQANAIGFDEKPLALSMENSLSEINLFKSSDMELRAINRIIDNILESKIPQLFSSLFDLTDNETMKDVFETLNTFELNDEFKKELRLAFQLKNEDYSLKSVDDNYVLIDELNDFDIYLSLFKKTMENFKLFYVRKMREEQKKQENEEKKMQNSHKDNEDFDENFNQTFHRRKAIVLKK